VEPAASAKDFVAAPVGTFFARRTFILCAPSAERLVVAHFASLDATEVSTVPDLVALPNTPALARRYDLIYDVSAVEAMDRATFTMFEAFVRMTIEHIANRTRRFAMVRPSGLSGHMFSGMFHDWIVPRLGESAQMFDERDAAFAWLAFPDAERTDVEHALDAFTHTTPLIRQMREALVRNQRVRSLAAVAMLLGTSARSLQRHLAATGTTFRDELARARIRAAQALLVDSALKIETIATDLGFKSVAAFTTMFRTAVGDTPAAYRDRRRR
jgi:AraC-like DNA-binding protein